MNLLITGAWNCTDSDKAELEKRGYRISFLQNERDELPSEARSVDAVICNGLFLFHPIEEFTNLKTIQLTSAGLDRVPLAYIEEHGIRLYNAGGVYSIPMAEFALSGVLDLYKRKVAFRKSQAAHRWEKRRDLLELFGKRVLIVGCGSVGRACAERFSAFGCETSGVDVVSVDSPLFDRVFPIGEIGNVLPEYDVVVLSLPLTPATERLFDGRLFSRMKDGAVFVNLARGALVDLPALLDRLPRLRGAVLDVFPEEPLDPSSPLWDEENVILTPHNSFVSDGNAERLRRLIYQNLKGNLNI